MPRDGSGKTCRASDAERAHRNVSAWPIGVAPRSLGIPTVRGSLRPEVATLRPRVRDDRGPNPAQISARTASVERDRRSAAGCSRDRFLGHRALGSEPAPTLSNDGWSDFSQHLSWPADRAVFHERPRCLCHRPCCGISSALREIATPDEREKILALYRNHRRELKAGRIDIPRRMPPLSGHNLWDSNMPGSTLFMPVCDISLALIGLIAQFVDTKLERFVPKHRGGMNILDDRRGFCAAGTEEWLKSGFLDEKQVLPLSVLERQACYFTFSEPAMICQNIFLATEALGVGGWMHCGFLSAEILAALGFTTAVPSNPTALANPIGLDGIFEACCPPYYPNMDAAVDAALAALSRKPQALADPSRAVSNFRVGASRSHRRDQRRGNCLHQGNLQLHLRNLRPVSRWRRRDASNVDDAGPPSRHRLLRQILPSGRLRADARRSSGEMASLVLRCIQMIQSQPNRLARPCAGYPRKPARRVPRLVDGRATPGHDD
jgi:hypothetical protein